MELKTFTVVKVITEAKRNSEKTLSSNGKSSGVQRVFKMASLLKSYVVSENFKTHRKEKVELRVGNV